MNAILIAIGVIAGIGALAALALAIADKYLAVQEDPRIGLATAALPGEIAQLCLTLCDPMDCSQPGLSDHGMLQARMNPGLSHRRQILY